MGGDCLASCGVYMRLALRRAAVLGVAWWFPVLQWSDMRRCGARFPLCVASGPSCCGVVRLRRPSARGCGVAGCGDLATLSAGCRLTGAFRWRCDCPGLARVVADSSRFWVVSSLVAAWNFWNISKLIQAATIGTGCGVVLGMVCGVVRRRRLAWRVAFPVRSRRRRATIWA